MSDTPDLSESTQRISTSGPDFTQPTIINSRLRSEPLSSAMGGETIPIALTAIDLQNSPPGGEPPSAPPAVKRRRMVGRVILLGILVILITGALGSWIGYQDGLSSRRLQQSSVMAKEAAGQFQLGVQDLGEDRLESAKTRFEYVILLDPNFPGVRERLAQVLIKMAQVATPTAEVAPTLTVVPTPNTKNEDEQWKFVLQQMSNKNWDAAINGMDGLRKLNLKYKPIDVDGLYFMALRFRGVDKMLKYADLEGGIYDLSLAEKFAALDRDADGWRIYAKLYLTGAAYWEVNWEKVVEIFAQVAPLLPNLRDSSGMPAVERYRIAVSKYSVKLIDNDEYCKAAKLYESVLALGRNATMEPTATQLAYQCNPPTKTPTATPQASATLTRTLTRTPGFTLTATNTGVNGATATPTPIPGSPTPPIIPPTRTATPTPTK